MSKSKKQAAGKAAAKTAAKSAVKTASKSAAKAKPKAAAAKATKVVKASSLTPEITITLNHDQIAKRAFGIWVAKGRPTGQDDQNWREAKQALERDLAKRA